MSLSGYHSTEHDRLIWVRETDGNFDAKSTEEYFIKDNFAPIIQELPHAAIVFDIGGYIGTYALRIEVERPDLRIFSFEPEPYNYGMLVRNINLNNSNVKPFQYAISDKTGFVDLTKGPHVASWSIILYKGNPITACVYAVTIEEAMKLAGVERIDYIKIDVEGAEGIILNSIPDSIMNRVIGIELELHSELPDNQQAELLISLQERGFAPATWRSIGPKFDLRRIRW